MKKYSTLPIKDEDLLKECRVETFRSSGSGGQKINKTETAVRIIHIPTGLISKCQNSRSQYRNKIQCLSQLRKKINESLNKLPKRIKTKRPFKIKEKILNDKKKQSDKKKMRHKPKEY